MGGEKNSSQILIGQFSNYRNRKAPYDHQFIDEIYTVQSWWSMTYEENDEKNYIQDLAFKIFSIRPHNAGCEQIFSVLGWMMNKRRIRLGIDRIQNMAKLHAYYITNAKAALKYVYQDLQEEKFYEEIEKNLSEHLADDDTIEVEEEFGDEDSDVSEVEDEDDINNNNNGIDEYLNLASEELRQLLEV
ncbi:hypothetical protein GLOIN_2v1489032 [Rhizophagus irregularis DAOM 181602=DAOM 197198]|nr:hypothetical protein GLOIN_2v1489032 [Rhizophagus irregularis DAOM 181602=DAOM 197198]POG57858.1 hypothetical protein GLOIN_2v1489032 [Rhizophagus irregularis DAOM 181602=DAOM 197198]|eukprot:XP_025164724.1 hypothetical protein GLOIN_2v1489032 [Rhizophagus irregularis DAOM 181602=DAOM 197198]